MSQWKWNDIELEIDLEDADFQEKYENAFENMALEEERIKKIGKYSELTRAYCAMFERLYDGIFGEGTSEKLFGGKKNIRIADECYDSFIAVCKKDAAAATKRKASMYAKYKVKSRK